MKIYKILIIFLFLFAAAIYFVSHQYEAKLTAKDEAYKYQIREIEDYHYRYEDSLLNTIDSIQFLIPTKL